MNVEQPDPGVVLAVAVGRSRSQAALFDLAGRELAGDTRDHEVGISAEALMPEVVERLTKMVTAVDLPVLAIGMSLPGVVNPDLGMSIDTPAMGGWDGVQLAVYFQSLTDAPLILAHDAHALARSELFNADHPVRNALVVKASTGLGMGIIADGKVITGALGAAGEIGHTRIDAAGDRPCRCGSTGCLETVASGWALAQRLTDSGVPAGHVRDLVAAALAGDAVARGLLREGGRQLGEVVATAVNLLNPEVIVIGGDMAGAFDLYTAGVRESVYARANPIATRELTFMAQLHGDSSGLAGCAAIAIEHVLQT
ncbi:putative NBD/HSP70 family sugar kinase [Nocardioides albertanoniae]|uniref:Putative NBD/HSP70 family sugar kinase n=1 Tax=Nocardioides albertanoniae TaxID=1175486 RepID=A0A543ADB7_9ACTN|nr:ROK family protein [Nocardioides albertanoniae]TQL70530.1 putative NBD/HSP70 family sugar kinase [Nocardioides albertanoniae]